MAVKYKGLHLNLEDKNMIDDFNISCSEISDNNYKLKKLSAMSKDELKAVPDEDRFVICSIVPSMGNGNCLMFASPAAWYDDEDDFIKKIATPDKFIAAVPKLENMYNTLFYELDNLIAHMGKTSLCDLIMDGMESTIDRTHMQHVPSIIIQMMWEIIDIRELLEAYKHTENIVNGIEDSRRKEFVLENMFCTADVDEGERIILVSDTPSEEPTDEDFAKFYMYQAVLPLNIGVSLPELLDLEKGEAMKYVVSTLDMFNALYSEHEGKTVRIWSDLEEWADSIQLNGGNYGVIDSY